MRKMALIVLLASALPSSASLAREFDASHRWYVEGSVGTVQPGPGTNIGTGQNYSAHAGFQGSRWMDVGLSVAWANARSTSQAIETNVVSGGIRARGWMGERWSPYAEVSARLQHFAIDQRSVLSPTSERSLRVGGHLGLGVLYARSTWWAGLGAELHGSLGSSLFDEGNLLTFTTYNLFIGQSLAW